MSMTLNKLLNPIRRLWMLRHATSCGKHSRIDGHLRICGGGQVHLGHHFKIQGKVELLCAESGRIEIGDDVFINDGSTLNASACITIGARTLVGPEVRMMDCDHHDPADITRPGRSAAIVLGEGVWVGARAMILKGVQVGDHAVIGAGAVVTRDIPAHALVVGNPAQVVRQLR